MAGTICASAGGDAATCYRCCSGLLVGWRDSQVTVAILERRTSFRCPHPVSYGYDISNLLIVVSSSTNFIIYFLLRPHFRAALRDRISCSTGGGTLDHDDSPSVAAAAPPPLCHHKHLHDGAVKLHGPPLTDHVLHDDGQSASVPAVASRLLSVPASLPPARTTSM